MNDNNKSNYRKGQEKKEKKKKKGLVIVLPFYSCGFIPISQ